MVLSIGVALVMGGRDLGTAMILVFIGGVAFLIVGSPANGWESAYWARWLWSVHSPSGPNRLRRILAAC